MPKPEQPDLLSSLKPEGHEAERLAASRRRSPLRLRDIRRDLKLSPLSTAALEQAFAELPGVAPIEERVVACIVGVPTLGAIAPPS